MEPTQSPGEPNPALRTFRTVIAISWAVKIVAAAFALYLLANGLGAL